MKATIIRPLQRQLLVVSAGLCLVGCSSVQKSSVYQTWEQQAYSAYRVSAPARASNSGMLPVLLRTVAVSGKPVVQRARVAQTWHNDLQPVRAQPPVKPKPLPVQEQQYIADHYGI